MLFLHGSEAPLGSTGGTDSGLTRSWGELLLHLSLLNQVLGRVVQVVLLCLLSKPSGALKFSTERISRVSSPGRVCST